MVSSLFYDKGGVRITKTIFEVPSGTQYQIKNIDSVSILKEDPNRKGPLICILVGVLLLAAYGLGLIFIGLGIWWWTQQKPMYWIAITTAGTQKQGYGSNNSEEIREIRSALNAAME